MDTTEMKSRVGEADPKNQVGQAVPDDGVRDTGEPIVEYLNRVVGVVSPEEESSAVADLASNGFGESACGFHGEEGAKRIDFSGSRHGLLGKVNRTLHWANEDKYMRHYEAELLAGKSVVMAYADDEATVHKAHRILKGHGARYVNHFGSLVITELEK